MMATMRSRSRSPHVRRGRGVSDFVHKQLVFIDGKLGALGEEFMVIANPKKDLAKTTRLFAETRNAMLSMIDSDEEENENEEAATKILVPRPPTFPPPPESQYMVTNVTHTSSCVATQTLVPRPPTEPPLPELLNPRPAKVRTPPPPPPPPRHGAGKPMHMGVARGVAPPPPRHGAGKPMYMDVVRGEAQEPWWKRRMT